MLVLNNIPCVDAPAQWVFTRDAPAPAALTTDVTVSVTVSCRTAILVTVQIGVTINSMGKVCRRAIVAMFSASPSTVRIVAAGGPVVGDVIVNVARILVSSDFRTIRPATPGVGTWAGGPDAGGVDVGAGD